MREGQCGSTIRAKYCVSNETSKGEGQGCRDTKIEEKVSIRE